MSRTGSGVCQPNIPRPWVSLEFAEELIETRVPGIYVGPAKAGWTIWSSFRDSELGRQFSPGANDPEGLLFENCRRVEPLDQFIERFRVFSFRKKGRHRITCCSPWPISLLVTQIIPAQLRPPLGGVPDRSAWTTAQEIVAEGTQAAANAGRRDRRGGPGRGSWTEQHPLAASSGH